MYQPLERATGTLKAIIRGSQNRIGELYQEGSSRLFFPKNFSKIKECVVINTAGGITGGDKFECSIEAAEESSIVVTTQASEKVYKASNGSAEVEATFSYVKTVNYFGYHKIPFFFQKVISQERLRYVSKIIQNFLPLIR